MHADISGMSFRIREEARRLGFFKVGITSARPLPTPGRFASWLGRGLHGDMRYLERQAPKRMDPSLILADARSLLVLAMNYHTADALTDSPLKGRISRYAWGDDYHITIKNRLDQLLDYIRQQSPSVQGRGYVDTGPVMEKVWGAQTALGWMGKHTNLITRNQGSWFFIGIMLLNIDLECDAPEKDFCGSCTRCIRACPTGAIIAPYVLDARRCISYLTIELRGPIPSRLRPLIGNRIYGCDDCQAACPWNRFAVPTSGREFHPKPENLMPDLLALTRITPQEFKSRFKNSPILRATRDSFVRNVVVALGNSGRAEAIPALQEALLDSNALVRSHAEWAMGNLRLTIDDLKQSSIVNSP
jgi:epoxyqueuosine reductase